MTNSSVTQNEYDALVKACRPFRAYRPFNMIYAALLGILAGIVTGLVLTPSVAVCAVAGGATSALAYGFGMWAKRRSNPIFKVERMVASQLSTEEGVTSKPS